MWCKKNERTEQLSSTKRPEKPQKTTRVCDDSFIVERNNFTTSNQVNTFKDVGVSLSKSTIKRYLYVNTKHVQCKYSRFIRFKPLVILENRKVGLYGTVWTDETKINWHGYV